MGIVDFILNLAGVLLWLNWRSNRFDPLMKRVPATLMGTLRPAAPKRLSRWHLLVFLAALLVLRAAVYFWIGRETNWSGKLNLGLTVPCFSSAGHWLGFGRMIVFSFLSFGLVLGILYVCLLPLSLLAGPMPIHSLVTIPLGRVDGWPRSVKVLLPLVVTAASWWLVSWPLSRMEVLAPVSAAGRFEQGVVIGLSSYLVWKFPLGAILLLHLLNSYIYFGKHPFWKYVSAMAQTLLQPLRRIPWRLSKVDFAPLVALVILFFAAELAARGLTLLYARMQL
jgi:uncharacterized protein YggT (Ycf19 family)